MDKSKNILILVESPEKAQTISKIFKNEGFSNVVVKATIGHFTKIKDGSGYFNTGVHPDDDFKIDFILDSDKKGNITILKEQIKKADLVYICSDPDREGEAIAWTCVKFLGIPKNKYKRATYHAINKKDIFKGIEDASDIDYNLVDAANARKVIDKCIGYRLSQIVKKSINAKSVGRVQSPALMLIVDRDAEIENFKVETYYDLYLHFFKNNVEFKAKYQGTDKEPIKRLSNEELIDKIVEECKHNSFIVKNIESKEKRENPKPPFSTATFQQECSSRLGLTVKQSASCAQKLFEAGKISYHRTDDETFGEDFANELISFVKANFDKKYISGTVTKGKKDENAQEGHEALHVLDLNLTPKEFTKDSIANDLLVKVYRIIYNRTIACALKSAIISQTTYNIYNNEHKFNLVSNELKFDGFKIVYQNQEEENKEEDSEVVKETFAINEVLKKCSLESVRKETTPPSRYKEASFVIEMKNKGIGRPSTYPTIIETLKKEDRGYCILENKYLKSTDKGKNLSKFLLENFSDIISIDYTRVMEENLDKIAKGELDYLEFLKKFINDLEDTVKKYQTKEHLSDSIEIDLKCPNCGKPMKLRNGKFGEFYGCSGYPKCKTVIKKESVK